MALYNIDQVDTILQSHMEQLIDYVVDRVYEELRRNIVEKAYHNGENTDYFNGGTRTDEFLESFEREKARTEIKMVVGRIFQNINAMSLRSPKKGFMWTSHKSMLGQDMRSDLASILNDTNTGMWVTGSRKGHFWDDTIKYIDDNLDEIVLEGARKFGIPIKRM